MGTDVVTLGKNFKDHIDVPVSILLLFKNKIRYIKELPCGLTVYIGITWTTNTPCLVTLSHDAI